MQKKSQAEIQQILTETRVKSVNDIPYDNPYEHPRVLGLSDKTQADDFIGGANNTRNRIVRGDYVDKLKSCGRNYNNSQRISELLSEDMSADTTSTAVNVLTAVGAFFVVIPVIIMVGISFIGGISSVDYPILFGGGVWTVFGIIAIAALRLKAKKSNELKIQLIDSVATENYRAYEFTVKERCYFFDVDYEQHTRPPYYYIFTEEGMNFNLDNEVKYAAADPGSRLIIVQSEVNGKQLLNALVDR